MKKVTELKAMSMAMFLIGLVMLIESASTLFVLLEAPQVASGSAGIAWIYVVIKGLISLYVLYVGFRMMNK